MEYRVPRYSTVFPRISPWVFISYSAFKTWCLNETGCLFKARCLFLIAYFEVWWTYNVLYLLRAYVIFEHFLQETSNHSSDGLYLRLQEHFLQSGRVVFLHLTLQKTISR